MTPEEAISVFDKMLKRYAWADDNKSVQAIKVAKECIEKQIPKKPKTLTYGLLIDCGWKYECPNCGCAVGANNNVKFAYGEYLEPYENNCCCCGQALDWSEEE